MRPAWVVAFLLCAVNTALAEPAVTIRLNGPVQNRFNIVIVGDGYTASELVKYSTDVDLLVNGMFAQSPYAEYSRYFNVFRVDVASNESGVSHPEAGITRNTAFRATYNCGGIQRVLCANTALVNAAVARSVPPDARDLILLLVNDPAYGGSGGSIVVGSTHPEIVELMLHEMGHTFGLLGDEYTASPPPCVTTVEPAEVNVTRESVRESIKWATWIEPGTALPTGTTAAGVPGAYEGARYCAGGLFRPTYDSKMRTLGKPFEQINTEQLILRLYNFVTPFESATPPETDVTRACGAIATFSLQPLQTSRGALPVTWRVDGSVVAVGDELRLESSGLSSGVHRVEAEVRDTTTAVRRDPGALDAYRHWNLTITPSTAFTKDILGFPELRGCQEPAR
jgi:hypothetical protein